MSDFTRLIPEEPEEEKTKKWIPNPDEEITQIPAAGVQEGNTDVTSDPLQGNIDDVLIP